MDKISIIVPVYNVENYLSRCIDSLLKQTHENIEVILVNDASPDNSAEIITDYEQKDTRVKSIMQPQNKGVSAARNLGLDYATGDWIAFCDGDDWYLPESFEQMLASAKENGSDFVVCNYQLVSDSGAPIPVNITAAIKTNNSNKNVVACGPMSSCCHLFKKELFDISLARYPEGIGHSEELPVVPVLAKHATKISIVDKPLYCYYQRNDGNSASNSIKDYEHELVSSIEKMQNALGENFREEALFHITYTLFYGEILNLCKKKAPRKTVIERIKKYEKNYPNYYKTRYYKNFGIFKRMFLWCGRRRLYLGLRAIAILHSMLIH